MTEEIVGGMTIAPEAPTQDAKPSAQETASAQEVSETPEAQSKPPDSLEEPTKEFKKALKGFQKRIHEATQARYEAEERGRQEAERARQEAEYWRQQAEQAKQQIGPPRADQYQDYEQFLQAQAAFQAQKVVEERIQAERKAAWEVQQRQQQAYAQQQAQQAYQAQLQTRLAEAEKKFPDFIEKVTSPELPGMQGTPAFGAILESDLGPEVMYYLANNPARAHQIVSLSPINQVREIGRIEASLSTGKSVSQAPPPPASVSAQSGTATKAPDKMTVDEYYSYITRNRRGK